MCPRPVHSVGVGGKGWEAMDECEGYGKEAYGGEKVGDVGGGGEEESMVQGVVIMCFRPLHCGRVLGEE